MQFTSLDPSATVRAANVNATLAALQAMPEIGQQIIRRHRLEVEHLKAQQFMSVQTWLNALREIQDAVGEDVVREVGARIIENADFPVIFSTVECVLLSLNQIYQLNHRGNVGHYEVRQEQDGTVVVHCKTPYPRAFERGLVEGICRGNRANGKRYDVHYAEGAADARTSCVLTVRSKN